MISAISRGAVWASIGRSSLQQDKSSEIDGCHSTPKTRAAVGLLVFCVAMVSMMSSPDIMMMSMIGIEARYVCRFVLVPPNGKYGLRAGWMSGCVRN